MLHINALTESGLLHMVQNGVTGILTIVGIAVGVAIPHVLAQKYFKALKERRIKQHLATRHINDGQ